MLFYRVLKILGCNHGCHESQRPPGGIGGVGVQVPISSVETLRNRHSDLKLIIPFGNTANSESLWVSGARQFTKKSYRD